MEGKPQEQKVKRKVAIVGCSDHKSLAPFADESWEIWGVNNLYHHITRWTRWFELHSLKKEGATWYRRSKFDQKQGTFEWSQEFRGQTVNDYIAGLTKMTCPVYMQQHWDEIPNSLPYPLQEVCNVYGNYYTNTISYQIAMAIYERFDVIAIYGVDMAVDTEYHWQRPSCEYFIGVARGLGIEVILPPQSDLMKARYLYAFEEKEETEWAKKIRHIKLAHMEKLKAAQAQLKQLEQEIHMRMGLLDGVREIDKIWKA